MGDLPQALKAFEYGMRLGNSFESYYYLGLINARLARETGNLERCRTAKAAFKTVVERGDWASPVFHRAERLWRRGKKDKALLGWMIAAERGYEAAQNNVAWILDRGMSCITLAGAVGELTVHMLMVSLMACDTQTSDDCDCRQTMWPKTTAQIV